MFPRLARLVFVCSACFLSACAGGGGGGHHGGSSAGVRDEALPVVESVSPHPDARVVAGQTASFQVTLDGSEGTVVWSVDGQPAGVTGLTFQLPTSVADPSARTVQADVSAPESPTTSLIWNLTIEPNGGGNLPPTIVSGLPAGSLTLLSQEEIHLSVAAADGDTSDSVQYHWELDGHPSSGSLSTLALKGATLTAGPHTVEVSVDDGKKRQDEPVQAFQWTIQGLKAAPANRPPVIDSASPDGPIRISTESALKLEVRASDPDGDPLTYRWEVDGAARSEIGPVLVFRPQSGQDRLSVARVTVDDGHTKGGAAIFEWRIDAVTPIVHFRSDTGSVDLAWQTVSQNVKGGSLAVDGYRIYQGRRQGDYHLARDVGRVTQAQIEDLDPGSQYYFAVTAYDAKGNESDFSTPVSLEIP
jgi:hypothetical protein